jgi:hypothetical protein
MEFLRHPFIEPLVTNPGKFELRKPLLDKVTAVIKLKEKRKLEEDAKSVRSAKSSKKAKVRLQRPAIVRNAKPAENGSTAPVSIADNPRPYSVGTLSSVVVYEDQEDVQIDLGGRSSQDSDGEDDHEVNMSFDFRITPPSKQHNQYDNQMGTTIIKDDARGSGMEFYGQHISRSVSQTASLSSSNINSSSNTSNELASETTQPDLRIRSASHGGTDSEPVVSKRTRNISEPQRLAPTQDSLLDSQTPPTSSNSTKLKMRDRLRKRLEKFKTSLRGIMIDPNLSLDDGDDNLLDPDDLRLYNVSNRTHAADILYEYEYERDSGSNDSSNDELREGRIRKRTSSLHAHIPSTYNALDISYKMYSPSFPELADINHGAFASLRQLPEFDIDTSSVTSESVESLNYIASLRATGHYPAEKESSISPSKSASEDGSSGNPLLDWMPFSNKTGSFAEEDELLKTYLKQEVDDGLEIAEQIRNEVVFFRLLPIWAVDASVRLGRILLAEVRVNFWM